MGLFLYFATSTFAVDVREMSIDEYINFVNPPAVHKYKGLKKAPKLTPWKLNNSSFDSGNVSISKLGVQSECPEGTMANKEIKREDVERAGSVRQFLDWGARKPVFPDNFARQHAMVQFGSPSEALHGISGVLNVWRPIVGNDAVFSLSQLWFVHITATKIESIEVGWMVNPEQYGDEQTRLFVYWTSDSYHNGCYDLLCEGYVPVNDGMLPGHIIEPVSVDGGEQHDVKLSVDYQVISNVGPAWVFHYEGEPMGYWPVSLFGDLNQGATYGAFGGEVCYTARAPGTRLTRTDMGSGHFPEAGLGHAAYIRHMVIHGADGNELFLHPETLAGSPECYQAEFVDVDDDPEWRRGMLFGGPGGYNMHCVE
eukprot:PITA_08170